MMSTWTGSSRELLYRGNWAIHASRVALLAVVVIFGLLGLTGQELSLQTQMGVYLVGMVALNLPHGGYEHFENLRYRGLPFGGKYVVLYLSFIGLFIGLFFLAPLAALGIAFATAVAKGGHGGLHVMDAVVGSDHLVRREQRLLAAFVRGGAVMVVPLLVWPEVFYGFSSYMVSMFDPGATSALWNRQAAARPLLGGLYGLSVVAHLGGGYLTNGLSASWLTDLGETALLLTYFTVVPVVVSIGLYFPLWYSMRQSGRTLAVRRETPTDRQLPALVVWGALITGALVTALLAAVLWVVSPNPLGNATLLPGLVAFYTVFICIVALPHVVVGQWLDVDRGIWYVP